MEIKDRINTYIDYVYECHAYYTKNCGEQIDFCDSDKILYQTDVDKGNKSLLSSYMVYSVQFSTHLLNQKNSGYPIGCPEFFLLVTVVTLCSMTFEVMSSRSHCDLRANNLRTSKNDCVSFLCRETPPSNERSEP